MAESQQGPMIMEHREQEIMVAPDGVSTPTLRAAHFLTPTITRDHLPSLSFPCSTSPSISSHLKLHFTGSRTPPAKWPKWVNHLKPTHQETWKKAGIFEAIMASTYEFPRDKDLILALAERWSIETNTFVFPWGEATITLEDMLALQGYSLVGGCVLCPLSSFDLIDIQEGLNQAHKDIRLSDSKSVTHSLWMDYFMASGEKLEHEAFLVLWLLRFVLTDKYYYVSKKVFPAAIYLSRGVPLALAPAVLARIYTDLSILKKTMINLSKLGADKSDSGVSVVNLWGPLQLVQIWAWERFPALRPIPNVVNPGMPRSARWHGLKTPFVGDVRAIMDSSGDSFLWRPYGIFKSDHMPCKFYRETEEWVEVESEDSMDEDIVSYARCLRVSELVGMDHIEQYLPHRVAMQFGFDQDLPGNVVRYNSSQEVAWCNYTRPIRDAKIYIPPRLFESDVTSQYLEWRTREAWVKDKINRRPRSRMKMRRLSSIDEQISRLPFSFSTCHRVNQVDNVEEHNLTNPVVFYGKGNDNGSGNKLADIEEPNGTIPDVLICKGKGNNTGGGLSGKDERVREAQVPSAADIGGVKDWESSKRFIANMQGNISMGSENLAGKGECTMKSHISSAPDSGVMEMQHWLTECIMSMQLVGNVRLVREDECPIQTHLSTPADNGVKEMDSTTENMVNMQNNGLTGSARLAGEKECALANQVSSSLDDGLLKEIELPTKDMMDMKRNNSTGSARLGGDDECVVQALVSSAADHVFVQAGESPTIHIKNVQSSGSMGIARLVGEDKCAVENQFFSAQYIAASEEAEIPSNLMAKVLSYDSLRIEGQEKEEDDVGTEQRLLVSIDKNEKVCCKKHMNMIKVPELETEARISRLERIVALIKSSMEPTQQR